MDFVSRYRPVDENEIYEVGSAGPILGPQSNTRITSCLDPLDPLDFSGIIPDHECLGRPPNTFEQRRGACCQQDVPPHDPQDASDTPAGLLMSYSHVASPLPPSPSFHSFNTPSLTTSHH